MTTVPTLHKRSDRMRWHEDQWRATLPRKQFTILRVDGRAFHTLTRSMSKPFDPFFMASMDEAAVALCEEVQGAQFAYIQSDEISLLLTDFGSMQEPWFGGVVQKMCSISAVVASTAFNVRATGKPGQFDSRVFTLPSREEAINYFLWRQADCHRNAISMVAEAHFPSKQLLGKGVTERHQMLTDKGVNYHEDYPDGARLGRVVVKVAEEAPVTYRRKDTGEEKTELVTRHRWEVQPAPWFDWDEAGFLESKVPTSPDSVEAGEHREPSQDQKEN